MGGAALRGRLRPTARSPEPGIVSISTGVESLYVEDEAYVDRHRLIFDGVHNLALDPNKSLDLIESIAAEHDKRA
nr:Scr1 family TA system antitoxin-like transcriptional regulator [Nocardiopsis sp. SBT366]